MHVGLPVGPIINRVPLPGVTLHIRPRPSASSHSTDGRCSVMSRLDSRPLYLFAAGPTLSDASQVSESTSTYIPKFRSLII